MAYKFVLLFLFTSVLSLAQENNIVVTDEMNVAITGADVFNTTTGISTETNQNGIATLSFINGENTIIVLAEGYSIEERIVVYPFTEDQQFSLTKNTVELDAVIVRNQAELRDRIRKLQDVEGTEIYAGKKTEVVQVQNLLANKTTNNARQIYSQIVGLNIYEDCSGGTQLNIGGRGLDPNRSANFNTRQNGYDISADLLGYPESYYSPPADAINEIQIIRGAASIQYGPQLGGLVNFKLVEPSNESFDGKVKLSHSSFDTYAGYAQASGTVGKLQYLGYAQYKQGNCFRSNSEYESLNAFGKLQYNFTDRTSLSAEFTHLNSLAQQPGGITDSQFEIDPTFTNRERNWFEVDWNLFSTRFEHDFKKNNGKFSWSLNGLSAGRNSLGFRVNRVSQNDTPDSFRDLIKDDFLNASTEARYLQDYKLGNQTGTGLIGVKYYRAQNDSQQGAGSTGSDANFNIIPDAVSPLISPSEFTFPNSNLAIFTEQIFRVSDQFSITPGLRYETIKTETDGEFTSFLFDLAGNLIFDETTRDDRVFERDFLIYGVGLSYKHQPERELYANYSTNFRSVTFNDIRINNPNFRIDPDITDETGFNADIGYRGQVDNILDFDVSVFGLQYDNRIGEIIEADQGRVIRVRSNIGKAFNWGFESFGEWNLANTFFNDNSDLYTSVFVNFAYTDSQYTDSERPGVEGNQVEFIPTTNLKSGVRFGYKNLLGNFQYTAIGEQFTDATNSPQDLNDNQSGVIGEIPAYQIADLSLSYKLRRFTIETGSNNLFDESYFTRRATGYPGPGIIPSDRQSFYVGVEMKF